MTSTLATRSSDSESYNYTKKATSGFYLTDFIKEPFSANATFEEIGQSRLF